MVSLIGKLVSFARTPAGQRALRTATTKAQELAKDPRTKDKVAQVRERLQGPGASKSEGDGSPATADPAPDHGHGRPEGPTDRS